MYQKLKDFIATDVYFFSFLIVLVSVLSFGLGRLSMQEHIGTQSATVALTSQPEKEAVANTPATHTETENQFVGSKNGTKYHALWCPGAKQIKETNKVYFASPEEAQAKGYTPAANCKGI